MLLSCAASSIAPYVARKCRATFHKSSYQRECNSSQPIPSHESDESAQLADSASPGISVNPAGSGMQKVVMFVLPCRYVGCL